MSALAHRLHRRSIALAPCAIHRPLSEQSIEMHTGSPLAAAIAAVLSVMLAALIAGITMVFAESANAAVLQFAPLA
jgi:hypothetical protein